jgi:hypothetical protein
MSATRLRNQILMAVRRDAGLRLAELCEITGAPLADVRSACWAMCNTGTLDYCQGGYFRAASTETDAAQEDVSADGYAVPAALRNARFVPRQAPGRREPARVTAGAFRARGLPVPEYPAQQNVYQLTGRQGLAWTPGIDAHAARRGAELLGGEDFLCVDCDTTLAVDGSVWLSGMRWLADAATAAGELLDMSACVAVQTPGDRDRGHAPGWHLWFRRDPAYPVRLGPLRRCPAVEIKGRATAPGSPRYRVCSAPGELPLLPRWLADIAGPPPVPAAPRAGSGTGGAAAWHRLHGVVNCVLAADRGERNRTLYWGASRAGELVAAGVFEASAVERALCAAAGDIGLLAEDGERAVLATIRSGFQRAGVMAHAGH